MTIVTINVDRIRAAIQQLKNQRNALDRELVELTLALRALIERGTVVKSTWTFHWLEPTGWKSRDQLSLQSRRRGTLVEPSTLAAHIGNARRANQPFYTEWQHHEYDPKLQTGS